MQNALSETEFLMQYDPDLYDRLSLTADILIFSVSDGAKENYRRLNPKHFSVLLIKRTSHPFKGQWCLPGGFIRIDEELDEAPKRILAKETNLHNIYMEQLYTFGAVDRDPRMRIINTSFMALIDKDRLEEKLVTDASWFNLFIEDLENFMHVRLDNGQERLEFRIEKILKEQTTNRYKYAVTKNDGLAFDHALVIAFGISRLKNKIEYTDIVFNMMPKLFTLKELQQVYEVILGKKLLDPAFRRMIAHKVQKTNQLKTGAGHRPSVLYTYREKPMIDL